MHVYMQTCLHALILTLCMLLGWTHAYLHNFTVHMIGLLLGRGGGWEGETQKVDFQKDEYFCGFDTVFSASFDGKTKGEIFRDPVPLKGMPIWQISGIEMCGNFAILAQRAWKEEGTEWILWIFSLQLKSYSKMMQTQSQACRARPKAGLL